MSDIKTGSILNGGKRVVVIETQRGRGIQSRQRAIKVIDNSERVQEHRDLAFSLKLKTPVLVPAAGETFDYSQVLQKPTVEDMNLFDKTEDKFFKKVDTAYNWCQENGMTFQFFTDRIDKIVMTSAIQGNLEYENYVKKSKKTYKMLAQKLKFDKATIPKDENGGTPEEQQRNGHSSSQKSFLEKLKILNNRVQTFQEAFQSRKPKYLKDIARRDDSDEHKTKDKKKRGKLAKMGTRMDLKLLKNKNSLTPKRRHRRS